MEFGQSMMPSMLLKPKSNKIVLSFFELISLKIQRINSRLAFVVIGPLVHYLVFKRFRITIENLMAIRRQYKAILKEATGPILVCPNHLTLVDSIIQAVALNSLAGHFFHFRSLPWNLPEKKNFYHKILWRLLCYLGKSIPVVRGASPVEGKKSVEKMHYLLKCGEIISIFPEGKRSRSGFVDDVDYSYAVGHLLKEFPETNVLCLYMRGIKSGGFSNFPMEGENFYFELKLIKPESKENGLKKVRDLSKQVITELKAMENNYLLKGSHANEAVGW